MQFLWRDTKSYKIVSDQSVGAVCLHGLDETIRTNTTLAIKHRAIYRWWVGFEVLYGSLMVSFLSGQRGVPRDQETRLTIDLIGRLELSIDDLINDIPSLLVTRKLGTWRGEVHE